LPELRSNDKKWVETRWAPSRTPSGNGSGVGNLPTKPSPCKRGRCLGLCASTNPPKEMGERARSAALSHKERGGEGVRRR